MRVSLIPIGMALLGALAVPVPSNSHSGTSVRQSNLDDAQDIVSRAGSDESELVSRLSHSVLSDQTIDDFLIGAESENQKALQSVESAMTPYSSALSRGIGNFLLTPYVSTITIGADTLLTVADSRLKMANSSLVNALTDSYDSIITLGKSSYVDVSRLSQLSSKIKAKIQ